MKQRGKWLVRDPRCERKRLHTVCGIFAGVSGLSIPPAPRGAVHIADVRISETERGGAANIAAGKVWIERLSIEGVAGGYQREVVIGVGPQTCWVLSVDRSSPPVRIEAKDSPNFWSGS